MLSKVTKKEKKKQIEHELILNSQNKVKTTWGIINKKNLEEIKKKVKCKL